MLALDTETTGIDLYHGAKPFFVTICLEDQDGDTNLWWEWDVDPLTRQPAIPPEDVQEILRIVQQADSLVLQNAKFDVAALASLSPIFSQRWPWRHTNDTLLAGHLLASNKPHNLTDMALQYLGVDIQRYEDKLQEACLQARRLVQQARLKVERGARLQDHPLAAWQIAEAGRPDMPSAKDKTWKYDTWLPRALAKYLNYPADHPWHTLLSEYANTDSSVTLSLWRTMCLEIERRGLWEIYECRRKLLPVVHTMESQGVTLSKVKLDQLTSLYQQESSKAERRCTTIASSYSYDLQLPKSGNNKSLGTFVFDVLQLEPVKAGKKKRSARPSLDKNALEYYEDSLPPTSKALAFIRNLKAKRKRDTMLSYMASYQRFWLPLHDMGNKLFCPYCDKSACYHCWWCGANVATEEHYKSCGLDWYVLHPNLNPTGTDTLRFSSSNPNEQNISKQGMPCVECNGGGELQGSKCLTCLGKGVDPRSLRYCFGPAPGREWWAFDAENIELRLPAYEAGEEAMIALFERPNDPPYFGSNHLLVCHILHKDKFESCINDQGQVDGRLFKKKYAATWYQRVKNGNFAVQYGAVASSGTADLAYGLPGAQLVVQERFSKMAALNQRMIAHAEKYGYVETMPDKTVNPKRGYPLMCSRSEYGRIIPTVPLNYHVQGTAMWWMIKAMLRCHEYLDYLNAVDSRGHYIAMQVHDELVLDFPQGIGSEPWKTNLRKANKIRELMRQGGDDIGVPTPVSCSYHADNWSESISPD